MDSRRKPIYKKQGNICPKPLEEEISRIGMTSKGFCNYYTSQWFKGMENRKTFSDS